MFEAQINIFLMKSEQFLSLHWKSIHFDGSWSSLRNNRPNLSFYSHLNLKYGKQKLKNTRLIHIFWNYMRVSIPLRGPNWKWKFDFCPVSPCWYEQSWLILESLHLCLWPQMIHQSHRTAACEPNTDIRIWFSTILTSFTYFADSCDAAYPQSPLVSATINFILFEWQNAPTRSCSSKGEFVSTTTY